MTNKIKAAWESAFKRTFPDGYWDWRFNNNPIERRVIAVYAQIEDFIAAYYAVSPVEIFIKGQKHKAGLMNMGFTHPSYQGRGYYKEINNLLHKQLKKEGYKLCFGFANHNSHYTYKKHLGWTDLAVLSFMTKKVAQDDKKTAIQESSDVKFQIKPLCEKSILRMKNFVVTHKPIQLARTENFLKWRLLINPTNRYFTVEVKYRNSVSAYMVFKKNNYNNIDIMEFFVDAENFKIKEFMLVEAIRFLEEAEKCNLNIWSNLYSEEHLELEKIGFRESEFSCYFGVINFSNNSEIENIKNWHYRFIDSDIF
ncbi:MAG: GNAT family N-acetyltransferase [Bacteroidetes bacterium]|nr:GNAT family N-acetyltransferase [Bacteroidota bacterium]